MTRNLDASVASYQDTNPDVTISTIEIIGGTTAYPLWVARGIRSMPWGKAELVILCDGKQHFHLLPEDLEKLSLWLARQEWKEEL